MQKDYRDGLIGFEESLNTWSYHHRNNENNEYNEYDIWIIYVTDQLIEINNEQADDETVYDHIEMYFTLFIDQVSPITTHMGISRNSKLLYKFTKHKVHKKLSLYLHSFAAKISQIIYPESPKYYMITSPVESMRVILENEMKIYLEKLKTKNPNTKLEDIIVIGNNSKRNRVRYSIKHKSSSELNDIKKKIREKYKTSNENQSNIKPPIP